MARRKHTGREVHGILLLDKPLGISSNFALQKAKRLFNARKAGHTGSLDPLATGMLPICFGQATKVSQYLIDCDKRYRATVKLGVTTTTGDAEGEIVSESTTEGVGFNKIEAVVSQFRGEITQIPPMYSAVKHQGKPLYKFAAKGIDIEREQRYVTVYQLDVVALADDELEIDVHCSKGTYIRTLAEDIGEKLGCGAHLIALRRYSVGNYEGVTPWKLSDLNLLRESGGLERLDQELLGFDSGLQHFPKLEIALELAEKLSNGLKIPVDSELPSGLIRLYDTEKRFFGFGEAHSSGLLKPSRIFHFSV